jgi:hypothetical protein
LFVGWLICGAHLTRHIAKKLDEIDGITNNMERLQEEKGVAYFK